MTMNLGVGNPDWQFTLGINEDEYFLSQPDDKLLSDNKTVYQHNNEVAGLLAFVSNNRAFLRLMVFDTDAAVQKVTIKGSFLKLLDLDPETSYVFTQHSRVPVTIHTTGHEYIVIRCNQCKNTLDNLKTDKLPQFSNVLSVVPCPGSGYVDYSVPHTGNKIMLVGKTLDNINIVFHDKWGQPLYGLRDFYLELTLDFLMLPPKKDSTNMMELKRV
jgi:hypothetical protein